MCFVAALFVAAGSQAEDQLNKLYTELACEHSGYQGRGADGISKERSGLRADCIRAWSKLGETGDTVLPGAWLGYDHGQKINLSACQYGGTTTPAVPTVPSTPTVVHNLAANCWLMGLTELPMRMLRRVDFASSRLPALTCQPRYLQKLFDRSKKEPWAS